MKIKTRRGKNFRDKGNGYKFDELIVDLPDHDCDVKIRLHNGEHYRFQSRNEGPSVDICIGTESKPLAKACYLLMADLSPGKKRKDLGKSARMAEQITIM